VFRIVIVHSLCDISLKRHSSAGRLSRRIDSAGCSFCHLANTAIWNSLPQEEYLNPLTRWPQRTRYLIFRQYDATYKLTRTSQNCTQRLPSVRCRVLAIDIGAAL